MEMVSDRQQWCAFYSSTSYFVEIFIITKYTVITNQLILYVVHAELTELTKPCELVGQIFLYLISLPIILYKYRPFVIEKKRQSGHSKWNGHHSCPDEDQLMVETC